MVKTTVWKIDNKLFENKKQVKEYELKKELTKCFREYFNSQYTKEFDFLISQVVENSHTIYQILKIYYKRGF